MERMVSTGVHRGLTCCSLPGLSMLAAGRRWGRVSLLDIDDGGTRTTRSFQRQESRIWNKIYVSFYSKQVNVGKIISRGAAGKSSRAHAYSHQSNSLNKPDGNQDSDDSALISYSDLVQKRREDTILQQQQALQQAKVAYSGIDGIDNVEKVSRGAAGKSIRGNAYSQQGNSSLNEAADDKESDSALVRYSDLVQKRREETILQQQQRGLQAPTAYSGNDRIQNVEKIISRGTGKSSRAQAYSRQKNSLNEADGKNIDDSALIRHSEVQKRRDETVLQQQQQQQRGLQAPIAYSGSNGIENVEKIISRGAGKVGKAHPDSQQSNNSLSKADDGKDVDDSSLVGNSDLVQKRREDTILQQAALQAPIAYSGTTGVENVEKIPGSAAVKSSRAHAHSQQKNSLNEADGKGSDDSALIRDSEVQRRREETILQQQQQSLQATIAYSGTTGIENDDKISGGAGNSSITHAYPQQSHNSFNRADDGKDSASGVIKYSDLVQKRREETILLQQQALQATSQQGNSVSKADGKDGDSALILQKRREETILLQQQASQQATIAYSGTNGIDNLLVPTLEVIQPELLQGTKEWLDLRRNRITASAFGNSLGFWGTRRMELWEEKIGVKEPFAGNTATRWGSTQEAAAVEKYKEITGNSVEHIAFKIYHAGNEYLSWLGASPDGLISYKDDCGDSEQLGILEVKCPHNRGKPEQGSPWDSVPHYYMPQAQGLLEIFDRQYMDFYVWTVNGSSVFRIERDPEYWGLMFRIMAEFWWGHVIPAKSALSKGKGMVEAEAFRPVQDHPATEQIVSMSRQLARNSRLIWRERMGHVQQF